MPEPAEKPKNDDCPQKNVQMFLTMLAEQMNGKKPESKKMPANSFTPTKKKEDIDVPATVMMAIMRRKAELERKKRFSIIYKGPISNRDKVRLN